MRKIANCILMVCLLALSSNAKACPGGKSEVLPFKIKYEADIPNPIFFGRLKIPGTRELMRLSGDDWRLQNNTGYKHVGLKETSQFIINEEECLRSQYYEQLHSGPSRKRSIWQEFDWKNMMATSLYKDEKNQINTDENTYDPLLFQLQLRRDLSTYGLQKILITYHVTGKRSLKKDYSFRILKREWIKTPIGQILAIKVKQLTDREDRFFWFAEQLEFLLVKSQIIDKKGKHAFVNVKSIELDGVQVVGH